VTNLKLNAKGMFFDLDGTIVDSKRAYLEAIKTTLIKLGHNVFDSELVFEVPRRFEQSMAMDDLLVDIDPKRFREIYITAYYEATGKFSQPFPNVRETLRDLSRKSKLALITRRRMPKEDVIRQMEKLSLAEYFTYVVTGNDTANPKPSPEQLMTCAKHMSLDVCECITVGDSVIDIRAGKNAGTRTVAVLSGIYSYEELKAENPDLILESVNQLPVFIK